MYPAGIWEPWWILKGDVWDKLICQLDRETLGMDVNYGTVLAIKGQVITA